LSFFSSPRGLDFLPSDPRITSRSSEETRPFKVGTHFVADQTLPPANETYFTKECVPSALLSFPQFNPLQSPPKRYFDFNHYRCKPPLLENLLRIPRRISVVSYALISLTFLTLLSPRFPLTPFSSSSPETLVEALRIKDCFPPPETTFLFVS